MFQGSCLCNHVQFEAGGKPDFPHLCLCSHCTRLGGSPGMWWVDFDAAHFRWLTVEPTWHFTWPTTRRGFCPRCGTTLAALDTTVGAPIGITVPNLNDHDNVVFVPGHTSFAAHAAPWLPAITTPAP